MDPVVELNQSLKAAGIHPSQTAPVVLHERGDIWPHVDAQELPTHFVKARSSEEEKNFARRLAD